MIKSSETFVTRAAFHHYQGRKGYIEIINRKHKRFRDAKFEYTLSTTFVNDAVFVKPPAPIYQVESSQYQQTFWNGTTTFLQLRNGCTAYSLLTPTCTCNLHVHLYPWVPAISPTAPTATMPTPGHPSISIPAPPIRIRRELECKIIHWNKKISRLSSDHILLTRIVGNLFLERSVLWLIRPCRYLISHHKEYVLRPDVLQDYGNMTVRFKTRIYWFTIGARHYGIAWRGELVALTW